MSSHHVVRNDIDSTTGDFPWAHLRAEATRIAHSEKTKGTWTDVWLEYINTHHTFRHNGLDKWLAEADAYLAYCLGHCKEADGRMVMRSEDLPVLVAKVLAEDRMNGHWTTWLPLHLHVYLNQMTEVHIVQLHNYCKEHLTPDEWADMITRNFQIDSSAKWSDAKDIYVKTLRALNDVRSLSPSSSWKQDLIALAASEIDTIDAVTIQKLEYILDKAKRAKRNMETSAETSKKTKAEDAE